MAANRDWDRLAEFTRERRVELEMTQEDVRFAGGPSTATMRLIEGALQQGYQPATLRDLEKALQWERGSVTRILSGGDPVLTPAADPGPLPTTAAMAAAMESHVEEILMRVEFARRRHPGQQLTGAMVFPASPRDALHWDSLRRDGEPEEAVIQGLAALAAWRQEKAAAQENGTVTAIRRA
jgi:hypothetical protein